MTSISPAVLRRPALLVTLALTAGAPALAQEASPPPPVDEAEAPDELGEEEPGGPVDEEAGDPASEEPSSADPAAGPAPEEDSLDDDYRTDRREERMDEAERVEREPRERRRRRSSRRAEEAPAEPAGAEAGSDYLWLMLGTGLGNLLPCGVCYSPFIGGFLANAVSGDQWEYGIGSKLLAVLAMLLAVWPLVIAAGVVIGGVSFALSALLGALGLSGLGFIVTIVNAVLALTAWVGIFTALAATGAGVMELMKAPGRGQAAYVRAPAGAAHRFAVARSQSAGMAY